MAGLTNKEIMRVVNRYIGVHAGYLGDFSYRSLEDFYPEYCDLDINPWDYSQGTMREAFIAVLEKSPPDVQAKIVRGVVEKYPAGSSELHTVKLHDDLVVAADRLERDGGVPVSGPAMTSETVRRALDDAEALLGKGGPRAPSTASTRRCTATSATSATPPGSTTGRTTRWRRRPPRLDGQRRAPAIGVGPPSSPGRKRILAETIGLSLQLAGSFATGARPVLTGRAGLRGRFDSPPGCAANRDHDRRPASCLRFCRRISPELIALLARFV
jgi:hypothetical protein